MKLTIYHLKSCDTCRKAIKALSALDYDLTLIDVRADGVPQQDLNRFVQAVGWETLLNTRSTTWRNLSDDEKADVDEIKAVALIMAHPTLMKRPVIETESDIFVGWKADTQSKLVSN